MLMFWEYVLVSIKLECPPIVELLLHLSLPFLYFLSVFFLFSLFSFFIFPHIPSDTLNVFPIYSCFILSLIVVVSCDLLLSMNLFFSHTWNYLFKHFSSHEDVSCVYAHRGDRLWHVGNLHQTRRF